MIRTMMAGVLLSAVPMVCGCEEEDVSSTAPLPPTTPTPKATESSGAETKSPLPPYKIKSVDPLLPRQGKRVTIHALGDITDEDCAHIIAAERRQGAPDGQVSVHIPMVRVR